MFTGIVEELGTVISVAGPDGAASAAADPNAGILLTVECRRAADGVAHGGSIAVNGVCLTKVADRPAPGGEGARHIDFDVMGVTLAYTSVGALRPGDVVNLERAVRADSRLDGHIVQGHVDGTATVVSRTPGAAWESVRFSLPTDLARYVARKGSIALDGTSLTVSELGEDGNGHWFEVGLIPETLRATNLGRAVVGTVVNVEVDVLAKYTERLLATGVAAVTR
jgi:riboflavin synthase